MEGNAVQEALCIFEDDRFPNFFPLSLNKPVFDLLIGIQTQMERIMAELDRDEVFLVCRPYLAEIVAEDLDRSGLEGNIHVNGLPETSVLFINGRLLIEGDTIPLLIEELEGNSLIEKNGVTVAARLDSETALSFMSFLSEAITDEKTVKIFGRLRDLGESAGEKVRGGTEPEEESENALSEWIKGNGVKRIQTGSMLLSHYWQLIEVNGNCLLDDFKKYPMRGPAPDSALFRGVDLINEEDIVIGEDVEVRSGTVLDASGGPIIIANGVLIEPTAIINGPCFIGEKSIIRGGAKIGHGSSIGCQCRIGGEVGESIVSPFTNKQHDGFLGHSYIGSWVNIGAGSCNSDLKNNYSKVSAWSAGEIRDTGRRFLGFVAGDHSKLAINTRINTGTVIGFCSNVLTADFPPKFIPSFTWKNAPEWIEYDLEKAVNTAEIMMDRRNIPFSSERKALFKKIFQLCRQGGHNV